MSAAKYRPDMPNKSNPLLKGDGSCREHVGLDSCVRQLPAKSGSCMSSTRGGIVDNPAFVKRRAPRSPCGARARERERLRRTGASPLAWCLAAPEKVRQGKSSGAGGTGTTPTRRGGRARSTSTPRAPPGPTPTRRSRSTSTTPGPPPTRRSRSTSTPRTPTGPTPNRRQK